MADITVPAVTVRTTSGSAGHSHGIVAGTAPDPPHALAALKHAAQGHARQLADSFSEDKRATTDWHFEVIDVHLVPGPLHDGSPAWVAYGTLTSRGAHPWASDD